MRNGTEAVPYRRREFSPSPLRRVYATLAEGSLDSAAEKNMAQAIVSPDELRRFAQMLKKFNASLTDQVAALGGQLEGLSATWRDQENRRFAEEFSRNLQGMARFIETNNEYIPFLLRKAERIDEYLQQR
jgi:uncharacterized protein YukE